MKLPSKIGFRIAQLGFMTLLLASAYPALAQRAASSTSNVSSGSGASAYKSTSTGGLPAADVNGQVSNVPEAGVAPSAQTNISASSPSSTPQASVSSPANATSPNAVSPNQVTPSYGASANGNFNPPSINGGAQGNLVSGAPTFSPPNDANSLNGAAVNGGVTTSTGGFVQNTKPLNSGVTTTTSTTLGSTGPTGTSTGGSAPVQGASPAQGAAPVQGASPTM